MSQLYIDLDGTLTDFSAAVQALGEEPAQGLAEDATEEQKQVMYDAIEKAGVSFWAEMKWKNDGRELWSLVKPYRPILLSSPGKFQSAPEGKMYWVKNNIPGTPLYLTDKKSEYVTKYNNDILIDDMKHNISAWEESGGLGILHTTTEATEKQLLDLLWSVPKMNPDQKYPS